ncbi:enoyl-CoA hydratase/isomerase family protein [Ureibacillus endophyticus]|uniref:Enoyl-CoA hydratase n=1 Tax=Ureibacillus endophyticus TaxID=1978490 RepID=A0A494YY88_9BACL|nr:enoyl-CoA hydratase [Lysinibacillus endophyticus]RKQ15163.1 enoyl-CoA hydratase [Lysinibacillus endophyticus]
MAQDQRKVKLEKEDNIAFITIENGPFNLLSDEVFQQLDETCDLISNDPEILVVILTGSGDRAFMAGADIKEFPEGVEVTYELLYKQNLEAHAIFNKFDFLNKPTIAAVNGIAFGGGCKLSLLCDIRIAEEQALFSLPEVKLGIFPGAGGTQRLPRLIGEAKAKELMFTGAKITAQEAKEIGLVNNVVSQGESLAAAKEMAQTIARYSLPSLQYIKQAVDQGIELSLEEGLKVEADLFAKVQLTKDMEEGVRAFLEKRKPNFQHQ